VCGIAGAVGTAEAAHWVAALVRSQHHRGPDAQDTRVFDDGRVALGHDRLRIVGLAPEDDGVHSTPDQRFHLVMNGEVYNYRELRDELAPRYLFRTGTDTEVVLAAWARWGPLCLDRLVGMFALLVWDAHEQVLHGARDRFGVKPLHHSRTPDGGVIVASEVAALLAAGVKATPDERRWATYLATGDQDGGTATFWEGITAVGPGERAEWHLGGTTHTVRWYDLIDHVGPELDGRPERVVEDEVAGLLADAVSLRFRSDVPVGVALSGGLDSSSLLGLLDALPGSPPRAAAFTFTTGDPAYDEDGEVSSLLAGGMHELHRCHLGWHDVPELAADVHQFLRQPYGGVPTLAYARLFERAREAGVPVVLDGQGLDEAWAGYDYYQAAAGPGTGAGPSPIVQGATSGALRPDCLLGGFRALGGTPSGEEPPPSGEEPPRGGEEPLPDQLRRLQLRDLRRTKLPRALRYNDGVSMRSSVELREPFLDHRLIELALRQPPHRTVGTGEGKALIRRLAPLWRAEGAPPAAAKRPVQTPQREWLRGPLAPWADERIGAALDRWGGRWFDADAVRAAWLAFRDGEGDNAHFVWQWVSVGLEAECSRSGPATRGGA
jgi:asparagine synthase (glutamine-hydrolysing)